MKSILLYGAVISAAWGQTVPQSVDTGRADAVARADVHLRPPGAILAMRRGFANGRYELRNATMLDLIATAWGVDSGKVAGGPDWLEMDRFDVVAKAPTGSTPESLRQILRGILEDRFHLVARDGATEVPGYALVAGRKPRLAKSIGGGDEGCKLDPGRQPPSPWGVWGEPVQFLCGNMTMAAFARTLPKLRGSSGYLFEYPLVDRTGLDGEWDFALGWSMRGPGRPQVVPTEQTTLFDALEKQLGLKLEPTRLSIPAVLVERVDRQPKPNPPGVANEFPQAPTRFEVVDIKLSSPEDGLKGSHVSIQPGGRIRVSMTLKDLIGEAWNEWDPDRILGGPKSMNETHFDVVAKAPAMELSDGPAVWNGFDIETMRTMLRAMLVDRFHLATHEEQRQVSGYALVAGRTKLRKADPVNRPGCKEGLGGWDGKAVQVDPRIANPMAAKLFTCRNMTLGQFAAALRNLAGDYLGRYPPVVDATGVEGRYDFTLNYSPRLLMAAAPRPGAGSDGVPSDPNGAISVFEALERQLGLKLESRKVIAPVLVVDSVDARPTAN